MEIQKTAEYTPKNQVLMVFVRDIHEDFVGQLDKLLENTLKAIYSMKVNLTQNTCERGYYDEFIEDAATYVSDKYQEPYKQIFNRQKLIENFKKDEFSASGYPSEVNAGIEKEYIMDLKEFTKQTLIQIVEGAEEANRSLMIKGSYIPYTNMRNTNNAYTVDDAGEHRLVIDVDFDV